MSQKFTTVYPISIILRLLGGVLILLLIIFLAIPIGFYGMAMYIEPKLPKMSELQAMPLEMPLQIYTKDNELIGHYGNVYSMPITYDQLPETMIQAFLAAEDDSFFEHSGISVRGLGRAITQMVTDNVQQTGGSTITQQVAKNYFLSPEQTFQRKLTEMFLARRIENELNKDEIMTLYVNKIYLGQGAYGVKAGAKRYYNKELNELTLAETAMLAGLPKAPSEFNPVANPKRAIERRNWILGRMLAQHYINQDDYNEAIASDVDLTMYQEKLDMDLPYLSEMARQSLVEQYGDAVMNSGWRVQLTVDSKDQLAAEQALKNGLYAYDKRHGFRGGVIAENGNINNFYPFDDTYPAQITQTTGRGGFEAILNTGETIKVASSAGRRLQAGNIVRVTQKNDHWQLIQIPDVQGAIVSLNPSDGALIAAVGGLNFYHNKFNRAIQGYRQPGSTIKPLIYAAAFETKKFNPNSVILDTPLKIGNWQPKNTGGSFSGAMTMYHALIVSRNIPAIRTYLAVGSERANALLANFGLEKNRLPVDTPAIALGATEATPLQMATAYATFVNGGHRIQPYFIANIYNFNNEPIYTANPLQACAVCFNSKLEKTNQALAENFIKNNQTASLSIADNNNPNTSEQFNPTQTYRLAPTVPVQYNVAEQAPRILSANTAYDIAQMLRGVITSGTGRRAQAVGRSDIGGKTGTTNNAKDAWFAGVQPTMATVVWVGFDTPKSLGASEYGGVAALPIWVEFTKGYLKGKPIQWVSAKDNSDVPTSKPSKVKTTTNSETPSEQNSNDPANNNAIDNIADSIDTITGEIPEGDGEEINENQP